MQGETSLLTGRKLWNDMGIEDDMKDKPKHFSHFNSEHCDSDPCTLLVIACNRKWSCKSPNGVIIIQFIFDIHFMSILTRLEL